MVYVSSLFVRILNRVQLISLFRIGYTLRILDYTFKIPIIENKEGLIYHLGVGEPYLLKVFQKLYSVKNFTFLDAGVNFGQTLLKIKAVRSDAPYIGFEPSGLCSYYTSHLIKVNRIANAQLIRCALSNSTGVLRLHAESDGDTRATIMEKSVMDGEDTFQEIVPVVTLDSLIGIVTASGKDIILKIDVEGAEWLLLQGARELVDTMRPVVVFENLPSQNDAVKIQQQQAISNFFRARNYQLFVADEEKTSLRKIEVVNNQVEYLKTNYVALPDEQKELLSVLTNN